MKKILSLLFVAFATISFTSCSSDDEPEVSEYDGNKVYVNAVRMLYDLNGDPAYTLIGDGVYAGQADSEEIAYEFISNLVGNPSWDNKDLTIRLGADGKQGALKILGSSSVLINQGIYNQIIVDVNGYQPYTLQIITSQKADNGYGEDIFIKRINPNPDPEE